MVEAGVATAEDVDVADDQVVERLLADQAQQVALGGRALGLGDSGVQISLRLVDVGQALGGD